MNPIERLTTLFERFPGIGPRQAGRFVQYLLAQPANVRAELAREIQALGTNTKQCEACYRWFVKKQSAETLCAICRDTGRTGEVLCVVEKDTDITPVERSGFGGKYFVLGGTIPLAAEEPEKHVRARELIRRIEEEAAAGHLKEVILGLSATAEGDHTRLILQEKLLPISRGTGFALTSLGRGLSTGSELEYADPETIKQALTSRR